MQAKLFISICNCMHRRHIIIITLLGSAAGGLYTNIIQISTYISNAQTPYYFNNFSWFGCWWFVHKYHTNFNIYMQLHAQTPYSLVIIITLLGSTGGGLNTNTIQIFTYICNCTHRRHII